MTIFGRTGFRSLTAAVALVLISGVAAWAADEILIGVNLPVTGGAASEGVYFLKAAKLAEKQVNATGGINGKKMKLVIQDNQSSNPGALAALNKSVEQDKVVAMLGPIKSTQIFAMSDAIKKAGIPTMIGGTNVNLTRQGNPWLFRCRPDDSIHAAAMVKYIKEDMKLTKIGILHDSDAFGTGGADLVEKNAKETGLTVVSRQRYTTKDKDYTAQLLALKTAGAEVMVHYGTNADDVAICQTQYRQLGSPFKYIGSPSSAVKDTLNLSKGAAEGLFATVDYVPGQTAAAKKYAEDYKKEYNEEMDAWAAWNYDALMVLANAIRKGGTDRAKIRAALAETKGYEGVLGTFNFTENGDGLHQVAVIQVEKGAHKLMKVVSVAAK